MLVSADAPARARWEVKFVYKGRVLGKKFGADLPGAIAYYTKAAAKGGLRSVTLRCTNMAFPPPAELQPHERKVRLKGRKKPTTVRVNPMRSLNIKRDLWWCPYCMKLRKFVRSKRDGRELYSCPMCGISHRDWSVAKHNPIVWERIDVRST